MGNVNFFSNGHTHNAYSNALDPNMMLWKTMMRKTELPMRKTCMYA